MYKLGEVSGDVYIDLKCFPYVAEEHRPRAVYFKFLSELDHAALVERGYAPSVLMELPRSTPEQEIAYLMAKAQAIEEGTITCSENELRALEMAMKSYNLLSQKHMVVRFNVDAKQKGKSLNEIFDTWKSSRHTLRGNSTVQGMELPDLKRKELTSGTGKRPKGDTARGKQKRQRGK